MFIDRELELDFLEGRWLSDKAELIIIYGRRGIGKTELIKQFIKRKNAHYFFVTTEDLRTLLKSFLRVLGPPYDKVSVENLESFYELIGDLALNERVIIIFDEFQRLISVHKGALSLLQKVWDEKLSKTKVFLLLVGSAVSVLEHIGKSYESPLYGRRTGMLEIKELDYWAARKFFPNYDEFARLHAYSILGGVPLYLNLFNDAESIEKNIEKHILTRGSELYDEPEILLLQETREPATYMSILRAIAMGHTRFSEISDASGLEKNKLTKYLTTLIDRLKLVEREIPIKEKGRGVYKISNNFIKFWFRYVLPNKSILELGNTREVLKQVLAEKNIFISKTFEEIAKQFLLRMNGLKIDGIKIQFNTIGRWWKKESEIDIIAINEKEKHVYFIECKYTDKPVTRKTLINLMKKSEEFTWKKNERRETYILFSKSGFSFEPEENTLLIDLKKMINIANKEIKIRIFS